MGKDFFKMLAIPVVFIVIVIVCMILFGYNSVKRFEHDVSSDIEYFLKEVAIQGSEKLNNRIKNDIKILETIASFLPSVEKGSIDTFRRIFDKELKNHTQFVEISLIFSDGHIRISDGREAMVRGREYFRIAMQGKANISEELVDIFDGNKIYAYGVPVVQNNKITGVIVGAVSTDDFKDVLSVPVFAGRGFSRVITKDGKIAIDTKNNTRTSNAASIFSLNFNSPQGRQQLIDDLAHNKAGSINYSRNGEDRYLSYAPIGINDWFIASAVPASVINSNTKAFTSTLLYEWIAIVFVFSLLIVTVSALDYRHTKKIKIIAYVDELTKIGNWKRFEQEAKILLSNARHSNYAILSLDIDHFRTIKELYSDSKANEILIKFAEILEYNADDRELCARYVEDVFVMFILYKNDDDIISRLEAIMEHVKVSIISPSITVSTGIYKVTDSSLSFDMMREYAIMAKNNIKECYGKSYKFFDDDIHHALKMEQKLEGMMEESLADNHFEVYYQVKYRLSDEKIAGAEALIRWNHPTDGLLSPGLFIPLFERNGFITKLDLFVFEIVCKMLNEWIAIDIPVNRISVNLSRMHLKNIQIVDTLREIVEKYDVSPSLIEVEFTEYTMMEYTPILDEILKRFQQVGFSVAMDDFGKGYSSLGLLQNLSVDVLKIDRGFFSNNMRSEKTQIIISNVIKMARELSIETVAEGIETKEQIDILRRLGCDIIQGYYFAKPVTAAAFEDLLIKENVKSKRVASQTVDEYRKPFRHQSNNVSSIVQQKNGYEI